MKPLLYVLLWAFTAAWVCSGIIVGGWLGAVMVLVGGLVFVGILLYEALMLAALIRASRTAHKSGRSLLRGPSWH